MAQEEMDFALCRRAHEKTRRQKSMRVQLWRLEEFACLIGRKNMPTRDSLPLPKYVLTQQVQQLFLQRPNHGRHKTHSNQRRKENATNHAGGQAWKDGMSLSINTRPATHRLPVMCAESGSP